MEESNPVGRPSKYKPEYAEQAHKFALVGLTDVQMADYFEVSESTFSLWKNEYPELSEALKSGRQAADANVGKSLYSKALDGDTTAAIFWLKNRQRANWRDRHEVEHTGTIDLIASPDPRTIALLADLIQGVIDVEASPAPVPMIEAEYKDDESI